MIATETLFDGNGRPRAKLRHDSTAGDYRVFPIAEDDEALAPIRARPFGTPEAARAAVKKAVSRRLT